MLTREKGPFIIVLRLFDLDLNLLLPRNLSDLNEFESIFGTYEVSVLFIQERLNVYDVFPAFKANC